MANAAAAGLDAVAALTVAGIALAGLCAGLTRSRSKASVESAVDCVIRIAGGDLVTKVSSPGKDAIFWLRCELNTLCKKLRSLVLDVRQTADGVSQASNEIASGNTDLSVRTESRAAALQQTGSAMQQVSDATRSNAQSTLPARQVVSQSSAVATRGALAMQDVIARMGEIDVSARKMSEIIGVMDGMAFQTNVLALNAAIKAAGAAGTGEQGRFCRGGGRGAQPGPAQRHGCARVQIADQCVQREGGGWLRPGGRRGPDHATDRGQRRPGGRADLVCLFACLPVCPFARLPVA